MTRIVDRFHIMELIDQCYIEQKRNYYFCHKYNCRFSKRSLTAENELRRMGFNFENKPMMVWTISYCKKDLDIFTIRRVTYLLNFLEHRQKVVTDVKFAAVKNSNHSRVPTKATVGSVGYDLFAAVDAVVPSNSNALVSVMLNMEIPSGYFGKVHPRSSLLLNYKITTDSGVIDSDYRGTVKVIMINHSKKDFKIQKGETIAQMIFPKKEDVNFIEIHESELSKTERGAGGFGSTGI